MFYLPTEHKVASSFGKSYFSFGLEADGVGGGDTGCLTQKVITKDAEIFRLLPAGTLFHLHS